MKILYIIMALLLGLSACAEAPDNTISEEPYSENDGRLFYSAWRCSVIAGYKQDSDEQARLFELGYKVGSSFVTRALNKTMDEEEWKKAPIGVTWELSGGPSVDYRLGYLFKSLDTDVYETVVKKDRNGMLFDDVLKWRDEEQRKRYAEEIFLDSNCAILR